MNPSQAYTRWWLPFGATAQSGEVDALIVAVHVFMAVLLVGWGIFFVWCLVRWRARPAPEGGEAAVAPIAPRLPRLVEIMVIAVEVLLLGFVSIPLWERLTAAGAAPDQPGAVRVRVVAQQYQWTFHYAGPDGKFGPTRVGLVDEETNPIGLDRKAPEGADDVVVPGALRCVKDRPLVVEISSKDVIHSFKVPVARLTRDAIPGRPASAWCTPTALGSFDIECAQLCGIGHTRMRGVLTVLEEADFQAWLAKESARQRPKGK